MCNVGIVVIGKNEGERLQQCLQVFGGQLGIDCKIVYVDSGSTDGSVTLAGKIVSSAISLDRNLPFTAARGRNEGFRELVKLLPDIKYVQFVDGDCVLNSCWLTAGVDFLEQNPSHAIVCGRLQEQFPEKSIYNRLCNIEWDGPVGDIESCGGIFMIRATVFRELGGMDETISAGEEPEMCMRLRRNDWLIARIPAEMAWHDANMMSLVQWWNRSIRNGIGTFDIMKRTRNIAYARKIRSVLIWTLGWGSICVLALFLGVLILKSWWIIVPSVLVCALYFVQLLRVVIKVPKNNTRLSDRFIYGLSIMIGKWAELYGIVKWISQARRTMKSLEGKTFG